MLLRLFAPRALLLVGVGGWLADGGAPLRVLRATPSTDAPPSAIVTVTFDRPVAGSLDRTVDPTAIFRIAPAVAGTVDWRDPVTLRFRPAAPLPSNASYSVTVANTFQAMDGSALAAPYSFAFRVRGARPLAGQPVDDEMTSAFLEPGTELDVATDAPVDLALASGLAYVDVPATCDSGGPIRLRATSQRAISNKDGYRLQEAGGWERDRSADPLRRVVHFVPERKLPGGCRAALVLPASFDSAPRGDLVRWPFATYGRFTLDVAQCAGYQTCPAGPIRVVFHTPVKGAEVQRHVHLAPAVPFDVSDTSETQAEWILETRLKPRTGYAVVVDTAIRDAFGQRLTGNPVQAFATTGYPPSVNYEYGRATIERKGAATFGVTYVNVDTLDVALTPVPEASVPAFLGSEWRWQEPLAAIARQTTHQRIAVRGERDRVRVFGIRLPVPDAAKPGVPTLYALQVTSPRFSKEESAHRPVALVQVTDLGVHAKVGRREGVVWVTGASDGRPRAGAAVRLHDRKGRVLASAVTDSAGLARLTAFRQFGPDTTRGYESLEGYVEVVQGSDRALVGINDYDPDLSPWQFNVSAASDDQRLPMAGAVFTERGIYRPGERVYAKAILRTGALGRLKAAAPSDSVRWRFTDREGAALRQSTAALSAFGTAAASVMLPEGAPLGDYRVAAELRRDGRWVELAGASYRVAEYRPPEFLVDVSADGAADQRHYVGDSLRATVQARYLFGAPMARAAVTWTARQVPIEPWELDIPQTDGYFLGETGWWYEEERAGRPATQVTASGSDTLDAKGQLRLAAPLAETMKGRPARATLEATVVDVNRQRVSSATSAVVHPAAFYLGAKPEGTAYFWTAGTPVGVGVVAVRPDGQRVTGVTVEGRVVRREWHQVRRERAGYGELVGEWVSDTVARCRVTTAAESSRCDFTPPAGGSYTLLLSAKDAAGRVVTTSFYRWAVGKDWVPWNDESQFKMDVVPDRARYAPGDTATILFASPFTDAEAWITVEREGLIQQRRLRITSGTTTYKLPITEALAPNAFVSILVARGRSAPPGPLDDPGRPTIRVGYAELRVTPERKRLAVSVTPAATSYRPGDTARVTLRVRDARGAGQRSEVTLWAVDEGVLSLTGYRTPDPIDLLYRPRGLGMRLASNLTRVAPQVPEGEKGGRNPGGGGGGSATADVLRSRFQTTAFFLGSVVTDAAGRAVATAKLPDNLTTFRIMAVAVTAGDRYGSGQAPLLVTKPLLARPALPRFVREGDRFAAGVVVNQRAGGTPTVQVKAEAKGVTLAGTAEQSATLESGRGREVRFDFRAQGVRTDDSATFRFGVRGGAESDAVELKVPVRSAWHERAYTVAGMVWDTASATVDLPDDVDLARSRLTLSLSSSPLAFIRGAARQLLIYPYECSEQVASRAAPLIALFRAQRALGDSLLTGDPKAEIARAVGILSRRQRADGGIGLWSASDWTSPWLSAYAGAVLLEARSVGVAVDDSVLARLGSYLKESLARKFALAGPASYWYNDSSVPLSERLMAVDYLSRAGLRDRAEENELLRRAPQLAWEDRVRLAQVLARGQDAAAARLLLEPTWRDVKIEGRRAVLPAPSTRAFYFYSPVRPVALLLGATLAVDPQHALVGPLIEALVLGTRPGGARAWNTQDFASAAVALADYQQRQRASAGKTIRVRSAGRTVIQAVAGATPRDSSVALDRLGGPRGTLALALDATDPASSAFYYLTVTVVPKRQPERPDDHGLFVERSYERASDGKPVTSVKEGELVRVRIRLTAPDQRSMVVLDDPLPAGLEAVDLSLRTTGRIGLGAPPEDASDDDGAADDAGEGGRAETDAPRWAFGSWDGGWWTPFDHRELRDDRVVYAATVLWKGTYTVTYLARATTPGIFARPPAHAEEMYNPAVFGESDGGVFTVEAR